MTTRVLNRVPFGSPIDCQLGRILVVIDGDNLQDFNVNYIAFAKWLAWKFRASDGFVDLHLFKTVPVGRMGNYHRRLGHLYLVHEFEIADFHGYKDEEIRSMMHVREPEYDTVIMVGSDSDFNHKLQQLRQAGKTVIRVYSQDYAKPWLHMWSNIVVHIEDFMGEWPNPRYIPRWMRTGRTA